MQDLFVFFPLGEKVEKCTMSYAVRRTLYELNRLTPSPCLCSQPQCIHGREGAREEENLALACVNTGREGKMEKYVWDQKKVGYFQEHIRVLVVIEEKKKSVPFRVPP